MSEDTQSNFTRRRVVRGPLVVTNPGNESDDDRFVASHHVYKPPPLPSPSPTSHSPFSEQSSQPSTSYVQKATTPLTAVIPDQSHAYAGRSNPSLSSPSGSSSPAVESTPPPSTPGQLIPPTNPMADSNDKTPTPINDAQQSTVVPRSGSTPTDKTKHYAHYSVIQTRAAASWSSTSPSTTPAYASPVYPGEPIATKVLVIVTADCEVYTPLDITGARSAAIIREKIFSKLQIADDQQPFFSIYRTEIGSFAIGAALTDLQLMEVCRDEGDSKGALKFLVQHTSAAVHLPPPPLRNIAGSHVPPVLPYEESYHAPSSKGHSPHSIHESMSSTSESRVFDEHPLTGYEGSISDEFEQLDRDRQRQTMRPPQQISYSQTPPAHPTSPLGQRRRNASVPREPSPTSRRGASPPRTQSNDTVVYAGDRNKLGATQPPSHTWSEHSFPLTTQPSRRTHAHTGSDAAAERERLLELSERQASERDFRADRDRERVKDKRRIPGSSAEPWVIVPSANPQNRPSTAGSSKSQPTISRPGQHTPSNSHSGPYPSEQTVKYSNTYSYSRLPFIPQPPRHPPPPVPTLNTGRSAGQPVPRNWAIKHVAEQETRTLQPLKAGTRWLSPVKSAGDLRAATSMTPSSRRPSQNLPKALLVGQKESSNALSSGSFINMDPPGRESRDTSANAQGLPRSYETLRNIPFSPTLVNYGNIRPTGVNASISQGDYNARLPIQENTSSISALHLNSSASSGSWKTAEDVYPRPHSSLDDIGASPTPYRTLPPNGSWVDAAEMDNEGARSPQRTTSPQHPFATANLRSPPSGNIKPTMQRAGYLSQSPLNLASESTVVSTGIRSPRGPESPRRTTNDRREISNPTRTIAGAATSFVPLSQESPIKDTDNAESVGTLKADEHSYLVSFITGNTSSSEGTLRPGTFTGTASDGSTNTVLANAPVLSDTNTKLPVGTIDPYTAALVEDDDDDDDDDDEGTNLWKTPLKQPPIELKRDTKRPVLSVDIEGGKRPGVDVQTVVNNLPNPANFPQPTYRPRKPINGGSKRDSEFIKKSVQTWAFRPPAEDMYENLDVYFPAHDLDKPVIEATSGGSSPTAVEPSSSEGTLPPVQPGLRSRHKKSIRNVAAEHKRRIDRSSRADSSVPTDALRRRNTKLWGSKVEEVTPYQARAGIHAVPESPTEDNPKPIFKWVRGELIGKGTYGRVYLALNVTTGEMIAVKQVEIPKTASDRDDSRQVSVVEALKLESETLKDLDHPNIVQYLGFERTPDFLSIFLEYVPGGSVAGCLRKHGKFDDQVSRSFTSQILAGLDYLHQNSIIHRDLKADNILVDPSGVCKISDFGISKRTDDINENGIHTSMQGSVFWMAPEVVQAGRKGEKLGYNGKVDIWSLGCVVLEMWAGRRPWQDVDAIAVIYELVTKQGAPPVPPDVQLSPEADDFRRLCFAIVPDERPTASELRKHPYLNLQPGWRFTGFKS